MGILYEYFSAASDQHAATAAADGPDRERFDAVNLPDLDPVIMITALEEQLTGVDYDEIADGPRSGHAVAHDEDASVIAITDELQSVLAESSDDRLAAVADPLLAAEEWDGDEPEILVGLLQELAGLARRATERGERLYCWTSL
jgi:hypothetical protein